MPDYVPFDNFCWKYCWGLWLVRGWICRMTTVAKIMLTLQRNLDDKVWFNFNLRVDLRWVEDNLRPKCRWLPILNLISYLNCHISVFQTIEAKEIKTILFHSSSVFWHKYSFYLLPRRSHIILTTIILQSSLDLLQQMKQVATFSSCVCSR